MNVKSALWTLTVGFISTRTPLVTVLSMHPCFPFPALYILMDQLLTSYLFNFCSKYRRPTFTLVLAVFESYPELFQAEIFSIVDAVVVDEYYLLSLSSDITNGMEVASHVSHATVHGLLLSNISSHHINCALNIVHTNRMNILTALNREFNAQKASIMQNAVWMVKGIRHWVLFEHEDAILSV